jgi:hypothetical protein
MTLCVAWRLPNQVWFASDSRLSVGGPRGPFFDLGIKICAVPVEIFSVEDSKIREQSIFKTEYGLAFSGNMMSAHLLREMLTTVLSRLQSISPDIPFKRIVKVVLAFYKHYLKELHKVFHDSGDYRFFLGGRCPSSGKIMVYKFTHDPTVSVEEVLLSHPFDFDCIGSGENHFREIIKKDIDDKAPHLGKKVFQGLRNVIADPSASDVGGLIQMGNFDQGTFKLYGVLHYDSQAIVPDPFLPLGGCRWRTSTKWKKCGISTFAPPSWHLFKKT